MKAVQHEHEFEATWGLPEALPKGEKLLWQGAPDWRTLARDAFHVRLLAIYFAAMLAWRFADVLLDGRGWMEAAASIALLLPLALLALGLLGLLAWLVSRTSAYTMTDKRLVMRIGIVLTVTFNLPYRTIESASLKRNDDGTGDIALVLGAADRIAYLHLWPHVRPWKIQRTQPMLRSIPDSARVSELLVSAISALPVPGQSGPSVVRGATPGRAERPVAAGANGAVAV